MVLDLFWVFVTGLAGSLHCTGMCGPLVVAYSLHLPGRGSMQGMPATPRSAGLAYHHGLFHCGRIAAYALIGAAAAGFVHLIGFNESLKGARTIISLTGGLLMIGFGLVLLKAFPLRSSGTVGGGTTSGNGLLQRGSMLRPVIQGLFRSQRPGSRWLLGFGTGFLPCMLSWAMVVKAAATANPLAGLSVMALFGLGTVPALLFLGFFASVLTVKIRLAGERIAALSVIAMGLILIWKGATHLGW